MKKSSALLAMLMAGVIGLSACAKTTETKYTEQQLVDSIVADMNKANPHQPVTPEQRAQIEEALATQSAVAAAAKKEGLDKTEHTKMLMALQYDQVLTSEYMQSKLDAYKPTDEELKKTYDEQIAKMQGMGKEYHLRHILVDTEAQAKDIIAKLKAGGNFADLAKASKDKGSAAKGGDLGWNTLDKWVPEFSAAASHLAPNGITETPVKTQYGYHVIQLVDAPRDAKAANTTPLPTFEQAKPQLIEMAKQDYMKKLQDSFSPKKDAVTPGAASPAATAVPAATPAPATPATSATTPDKK